MINVSVILTSYNQDKYLSASVESVLNQTFTDFELLICDDGSTDDSQKIIRSYKDERIKTFLYKKNRGSYFATQEPLQIAGGKYLALQHSDDIWELDKLEKQVKFMDENPQYEVCFTQVKFIDERGEIYNLPENHPYKNVFKQENRPREKWLNHLFWKSNCFCNPSLLLRNARKNFLMNPALAQLPDYFMWVNLCMRKNPYVFPEELIFFRLRRGEQNSLSSWSPQKLVRINNEQYFIAKSFLPLLRDEKFFLKVFPQAEEFLTDGKISTEFAFAQMCFKRELPAFQKLALEILYDLLHNENKQAIIQKLYGYDEKAFIRDTGNFDVFGIKFNLHILNSKLYLNFGEGFSEKHVITNTSLIRPDGNFTATFNFQADKNIVALRFDPDEKAALSIKIIKISVNGDVVKDFTSNTFQVVDGYHNFLTADPFFTIVKKISAENICVEILGTTNNDALTNFEKEYSANLVTINQQHLKIRHSENTIQQLKNTVQEKVSQIQHLENTLQDKISQIQRLENTLQEKVSQIQQLENSLQQKISRIEQLENSISAQNQDISLKTQQIKSQAEEIQNLQNLYTEILNSNSWKLTKPLRAVRKIFKN